MHEHVQLSTSAIREKATRLALGTSGAVRYFLRAVEVGSACRAGPGIADGGWVCSSQVPSGRRDLLKRAGGFEELETPTLRLGALSKLNVIHEAIGG